MKKWLILVGVGSAIASFFGIIAALSTKDLQPTVVATSMPQPTIVVSVVPNTQPPIVVTVTPLPTNLPTVQPTVNAIEPVLSQPAPTISKTRDQQTDEIADRLFYEKYPQLDGRKIQANEINLQVEWSQIRRCDAVVDYIFYQRHPSMQGRKIGQNQTDLRNEWRSIRDTVSGCN